MKKIFSFNWYSIGWLLIFFVLFRHVFFIYNGHNNNWWDFFWVCPLIALITGVALLLRNNFIISASIYWVSSGPLLVILFSASENLNFAGIHHFLSVISLLFILFHLKEIWNPKGFIFGMTSFLSYMFITTYLSHGNINIIGRWWGANNLILFLGLLSFFVSVLVIYWEKKSN